MGIIRRLTWGVGVLAVAIAAILLLSTCKKQDERNGIVGKVSVSGGGGNGGIAVSLYDAPAQDAASVWTTTQNNANVGFRYPQQGVFEWRIPGQTLVASGTTSGDGSFNFPNLENGPYVVVAQKDSFGWSEPMSAHLSGSKLDVGTIPLKRENYLQPNSIMSADTRWLAGEHYVLPGNLTIAAGATLTIEPGAVVRIGEAGGRINVFGTLIAVGTPEQYIIFTSNEPQPAAGDWRAINFNPGAAAPLFQYCAFRFGDQGIISQVPGGRIENCCFTDIGAQSVDLTGGLASQDSIVLRHNVVNHLPLGFRVHVLPGVPSAPNITIDHNAIFGCSKFGVELEGFRGGSLSCNYFYNCGRDTSAGQSGETGAIHVSDARNMDISHNEINNSWWGIDISSHVDSSVYIHHNHFFRLAQCFYVGVTLTAAGPSYPTIHMNCIQSSSGFVFMETCQYNTHTVDVDSNSWNGQQGSAVGGRMHDCSDSRGPRLLYPTTFPTCPSGASLCNN
ncbi:MAG TPA: hypothetical protein VGL38_10945 [bacterium]|jgi:hypothetical protein